MKISHKRKIQFKFKKHIKVVKASASCVKIEAPLNVYLVPKSVVEQKIETAGMTDISLTPKQQQIFDIVCQNAEGVNAKSIGLLAGQEEAKATSWAAAGLKKLVEVGVVDRIQLTGNKVVYKTL